MPPLPARPLLPRLGAFGLLEKVYSAGRAQIAVLRALAVGDGEGGLGAEAVAVGPAVAALLEGGGASRPVEVRRSAVEVLGKLGLTEGRPIAERLGQPDPMTRLAAATALGRLSPEVAAPHAAALASRLIDDDPLVREAAVVVLGRMLPEAAAPHAEAVAGRLTDDAAVVRLAAVEALRQLGQAVWRPHLKEMVPLLGDPAVDVRLVAAATLGKLVAESGADSVGEHAVGLSMGLARLLEDSDGRVRWAAVASLGQLGQSGWAGVVRPPVEALLRSDGAEVRRTAQDTLSRIDGSA